MSSLHPHLYGPSPPGVMQSEIMCRLPHSEDMVRAAPPHTSPVAQISSIWHDELQNVVQMGFLYRKQWKAYSLWELALCVGDSLFMGVVFLINRQGVPATGVPVPGILDQRPSRNDAWSQRMREKYGLDTSEFTYNPPYRSRYHQASAPPAEERGRCTVL